MAKAISNYPVLGENRVGKERDGQPAWRGWGEWSLEMFMSLSLALVPSHMLQCFIVVLKSFCVLGHGGTGCAGCCSCLSGIWLKWPACLLPA